MSRVPLTWYKLRWPREVDGDSVVGLFRVLASTGGSPIIVEADGASGLVTHRLAIPGGRAGSVVQQLRGAVPGLSVDKFKSRDDLQATGCVEVR
ncbi:MAG TPA: hypothetical protein VKR22_02080, partial [Acidimicrobiales bacterium]|nr:hypothetical protein [Acidimicrobiales bacterium]